jgi:hypothetical protein
VGALPETGPHDEFLELCAVSTSGELTEEEQTRLQKHLAVCEACRDALSQYQAVVDRAIPAIGANQVAETSDRDVDPGPGWSPRKAEKALFDRLAREPKPARREPKQFASGRDISSLPRRLPFPSSFSRESFSGESFASEAAWRQVWMLYAAGILLFVALSFFAYRVGRQQGSSSSPIAFPHASKPDQAALREQLSDAGHEQEIARVQIAQRDQLIADLRRRLAGQSAKITQMQSAEARLENDLRSADANRQDLMRQRTDLAHKIEAAETDSRALQEKLDSNVQQSAQDGARAKASEGKVSELTRLLKDREAELVQQDELLAHDRDIRDLMGARDLYIAEVYDIAGSGETKKPYGRVFYTRGKSLIFYAYDLDQQAALKRANTFQAWGRRGPDRQTALSLGVFYEDNASRKRWILKCDDPKALEQIDAVFVTVEPNGGSHKPSSKSLLFAYLKVNPNHP